MEVNSTDDETSIFFLLIENFRGIQDRDIVGRAMLIRTGKVDKEWKKEVERTTPAHLLGIGAALNNITVRGQGRPDIKAPITARGKELAKVLNLNDKEILTRHPQAMEHVRFFVNSYESVFTDEDVAVGQTELFKMDIKLTKQARRLLLETLYHHISHLKHPV